jgi:hypothetical protein
VGLNITAQGGRRPDRIHPLAYIGVPVIQGPKRNETQNRPRPEARSGGNRFQSGYASRTCEFMTAAAASCHTHTVNGCPEQFLESWHRRYQPLQESFDFVKSQRSPREKAGTGSLA